jgi:hypothetical protein
LHYDFPDFTRWKKESLTFKEDQIVLRKIVFTYITITASTITAFAQERSFIDRHVTMKGLNCSACHECLNPSLTEPCLKLGPHFFQEEGIKLRGDEVPKKIIINKIENLYGPVKYNHGQHMHMAERIEDCAECHHYIPPDLPKKSCDMCHPIGLSEQKLGVLSFNAVLHRKCLGCHLEWGKSTNCEHCHVSKNRDEAEKLGQVLPTYRKTQRPEKFLFATRYFSGPYVQFSHERHATNKNIKCTDCHVKQPCIVCHYQEKQPKELSVLARIGVHGTCRLCHEVESKDSCNRCHSATENRQEMVLKK